ncbi:putative mitochondrial import receptor subunit [Geopyxis carbonaria]|nr:putative mitochondrial import receptor subunit [Geopyxis carbonaria]
MIELHVWGPGFTLPSIDPLCLAAISYLNLTLPKDSWSLVASSNPLLSPTKSLPALRENDIWVSGFAPIVEYLSQRIPVSLDADNLDSLEAAKCTAFTAYIITRAQEILDLSLYVSHQNFVSAVRPLYTRLLPFPVQYYLPSSLRSAAKARTDHLGLTLIDVEPEKEITPASMAESSAARATAAEKLVREANVPKSLLKTSPETSLNIRLAALCDEFMETLEKRLGAGRYMLGDNLPSSLDCLTLAYLALLLIPQLPHKFANEAMCRHPRLCAYVHDLRTRFVGPAVDVDEVLRGEAKDSSSLPWAKAEKGDLPWLTGVFFDAAKKAVYEPVRRVKSNDDPTEQEDLNPYLAAARRNAKETQRREWWKSLAMVTGSVAAFLGYVVYVGILRVPLLDDLNQNEPEALSNMNVTTAQDMLSVLKDPEPEGKDGYEDEDRDGNEEEEEDDDDDDDDDIEDDE